MAKSNNTTASNPTPPPSTPFQLILGAIEAEALAQRAKAVANLNVYMQNPAGIGEHPDVVAECTKLIEQIGNADSTIETLRRITS